MCKFPVVDYYAESRKMKVSESSNAHTVDVLSRLLDTFQKMFPVEITVERITPVYSKYAIKGLDAFMLQTWFNTFASGHKPATLNNMVALLNPFLRWCHALKIVEEDLSGVLHAVPLPDVESLPEEERPVDKYLTHEQAEQLLNVKVEHSHNNLRDQAVMALILYSGLRVSELCSLTVGMMSDRSKPISVKRKGGRYTPVVIGQGFWPYLDAYLATRPDAKPEEPLFVTERGNACNRRQVYFALTTRQKALGLATGPHALRHTFVSEVENTAGAGVARDCANHKSLAITNRYDHTKPEQRQAAVNGLAW